MKFEKPGCFGFVATYNVKSKVCEGCGFNAACAEQAKKGLSELAEKLNVNAIKRLMQQEPAKSPPKKAVATTRELSTIEAKLLSRMSEHAARAARAMLDAGINHRVSLLSGTNSMKGRKPATISVLFDLLLAGPVTRAQLIDAFKQELGYTHATASSQASICITATVGIGIAKESEEGSIVIRGEK